MSQCVKDLGGQTFQVDDYVTLNFDICGSSGVELLKIKDCVTAKQFAQAEDAFLQLEREAMCTHKQTGECNSVGEQMGSLSHKISAFLDYTPAHHKGHIQQGTTCDAGMPSQNFSMAALCRQD